MQKEPYFTTATLDAQSSAMLEAVEEHRRRHADLRPMLERAALLVLDVQNYFFRADSHAFIPAAPAILPGIRQLIAVFAAHHRPIIFTRHSNPSTDAGMMAIWWKDLIRADSPDSEIVAGLDVATGRVIQKTQYDAFYKTPLEEILHADGVRQVIICRVMTHLCCETTARSAFMRGFEVFFTVDGTASYTESFHRAALLNLSHGFAVPVLVEEVLVAL